MQPKTHTNIPRCLNNRYTALNDLISSLDLPGNSKESDGLETGIKLLCSFWSILKEHPDLDLPAIVEQCINQQVDIDEKESQASFKPCPHYLTYFMTQDDSKRKRLRTPTRSQITSSDDLQLRKKLRKPPSAQSSTVTMSDVLGNLRQAAKLSQDCGCKLQELEDKKKKLEQIIGRLEDREKLGCGMLKEADQMWAKMEDDYKRRLQTIKARTERTEAQVDRLEESVEKWRKYKDFLVEEVKKMEKQQAALKETIEKKKSDKENLQKEIKSLKKKIEHDAAEMNEITNKMAQKKADHAEKMKNHKEAIKELEEELVEETQKKQAKEKDGALFIKDARDDLKRIQKDLIKKEMENETLTETKQSLMEEVCNLSEKCRTMCTKCEVNENELSELTKKIDAEIKKKENENLRCSRCTHTEEVRKFCVDCPNCANDRSCAIKSDHCTNDPKKECICHTIKQRFIENVFSNMQLVVSKEIKTRYGKSVAESVIYSLRSSQNGKLDEPTKTTLKCFILKSIGKNLTPAIVGGAVKTRCEMDAETYERLMNCLKKYNAKGSKADAGTVAKIPCARWSGSEKVCHCPRKAGETTCVCDSKAPKNKFAMPLKEDLAATSFLKGQCKELEAKSNEGSTKTCGYPCKACESEDGNAKSEKGSEIENTADVHMAVIVRSRKGIQCDINIPEDIESDQNDPKPCSVSLGAPRQQDKELPYSAKSLKAQNKVMMRDNEEQITRKHKHTDKRKKRKGSPIDMHRHRLVKEVMGEIGPDDACSQELLKDASTGHNYKKSRNFTVETAETPLSYTEVIPNNKAINTNDHVYSVLDERIILSALPKHDTFLSAVGKVVNMNMRLPF